MPSIGPMEIVIIMIVALIVLGPKKLPELGRSMGKGMREFKNAISMDSDEDDDEPHRDKADRERVGSNT